MQDPSISVQGCREPASVGDLHDVRVDVTQNDIAKVQDILRQLSSERRSKDNPQTTAWLSPRLFPSGGKVQIKGIFTAKTQFDPVKLKA